MKPKNRLSVVVLSVILEALMIPHYASKTAAQEALKPADTADNLMEEIRFLDLLHRLEITAEQRAQAATAIENFHAKQEAIQQLANPPELIAALQTIRETLLANGEPTTEMRAAVEAAQPGDKSSIDRAFAEARDEAFATLTSLLTDTQQAQLRTIPLLQVAEDLLWMCMEARKIGGAEGEQIRLNAFPELREQLARAAGDRSQQVLADFQGLINRFSAMTPEQIEQQREQLIQQTVALLAGTLDKNPELAAERLKDQLWQWLADARIGVLFRESARAMGTQ
ncbi:MAG: hypothetical protein ACUVX8_14450 [Candidatus Zipacnadales bacterium]